MKTNTVVTYCCEYCGKSYDKMEKAAECERICAEKRKMTDQKVKSQQEIDKLMKELSNKIAQYYENYNENPFLNVTVSKVVNPNKVTESLFDCFFH